MSKQQWTGRPIVNQFLLGEEYQQTTHDPFESLDDVTADLTDCRATIHHMHRESIKNVVDSQKKDWFIIAAGNPDADWFCLKTIQRYLIRAHSVAHRQFLKAYEYQLSLRKDGDEKPTQEMANNIVE